MPFIMNPPSPTTATTGRPGAASLAPSAPQTPKPIPRSYSTAKLTRDSAAVSVRSEMDSGAPLGSSTRTCFEKRAAIRTLAAALDNGRVRLWDVARTAEEINGSMFTRLTGAPAHLVGLWNFDDPEQPGKDASPNGLHGRLIGQAVAVPQPLPVVLMGRITQSSGRASGKAEVEGRQADGITLHTAANDEGEYAVALKAGATCDLFVRGDEESAYRLGFQPTAEPQQRLDWRLLDPEKTPVTLGSSRREEALSEKSEVRSQKSELKAWHACRIRTSDF